MANAGFGISTLTGKVLAVRSAWATSENTLPRALERREAVEGGGDGVLDLNSAHVAFRKRNLDFYVRKVDHLDNRPAFFHPLPDLRKFLRNPSIEGSDDLRLVQGVFDPSDFGM